MLDIEDLEMSLLYWDYIKSETFNYISITGYLDGIWPKIVCDVVNKKIGGGKVHLKNDSDVKCYYTYSEFLNAIKKFDNE